MRPFNDVDLHAFVDGQISPERQAGIVAHLAASPGDAARVHLWTQQNEAIRREFMPPEREPVPLRLTVGHLLSSRDAPPASAKGSHDRRPGPSRPLPSKRTAAAPAPRSPHVAVGLAFLAGLTLAVTVERWSAETPSRGGIGLEQRASEATALIDRDPGAPLDIADVSPTRVRAWLEPRLPFRLRVPDLTEARHVLVGARLVQGDAGPAALLIYAEPAGTRVSLFAGRVAKGEAAATATTTDDERGQLRWTENSVGFVWSADGRSSWLAQNAVLLRRSVQDDPAG